MRSLVALLAASAVVAATVAACEEEPKTSGLSPKGTRIAGGRPVAGEVVLPCRRRVEGAPGLPLRSRARDFAADGVILYGLEDEARRARKRPGAVARRYRDGFGAVKILAGVRAGLRARVAIGLKSRGLAGLLYGPSPDPQHPRNRLDMSERAVEFQACPRDEPRLSSGGTVGGLTHFAGGFLIVRAHCLRLRISVRGRAPRHYALAYGVPPERC